MQIKSRKGVVRTEPWTSALGRANAPSGHLRPMVFFRRRLQRTDPSQPERGRSTAAPGSAAVGSDFYNIYDSRAAQTVACHGAQHIRTSIERGWATALKTRDVSRDLTLRYLSLSTADCAPSPASPALARCAIRHNRGCLCLGKPQWSPRLGWLGSRTNRHVCAARRPAQTVARK